MPAHHARRRPVIVLAPDSFKGSLDAPAVCAAIATGLRRVWPEASIRSRPMADGGEGTLDAVLAACGALSARARAEVRGAAGDAVSADYGVLDEDGRRTAVIEVAQVVGITDERAMTAPVTRRDTRGVGELIRRLLDAGIRRFMIGLGGSSTNDGGAGLLCALGLALRDAQGAALEPTPEGLAGLASVAATQLDPRLAESSITLMSDVNNPFCGERGATAIFGPQKGVGCRAGGRDRRDACPLRRAGGGRRRSQCSGESRRRRGRRAGIRAAAHRRRVPVGRGGGRRSDRSRRGA